MFNAILGYCPEIYIFKDSDISPGLNTTVKNHKGT